LDQVHHFASRRQVAPRHFQHPDRHVRQRRKLLQLLEDQLHSLGLCCCRFGRGHRDYPCCMGHGKVASSQQPVASRKTLAARPLLATDYWLLATTLLRQTASNSPMRSISFSMLNGFFTNSSAPLLSRSLISSWLTTPDTITIFVCSKAGFA